MPVHPVPGDLPDVNINIPLRDLWKLLLKIESNHSSAEYWISKYQHAAERIDDLKAANDELQLRCNDILEVPEVPLEQSDS